MRFVCVLISMCLSLSAYNMELRPSKPTCYRYKGHGIYVDKSNKTIILDGEQNPNKVRIKGDSITELDGFTTEQTGFNWDKYTYNNYSVIIKNTNINGNYSLRCLLWFMATKFKLIKDPSSFISLDALLMFSEQVPLRSERDFADIDFGTLPLVGGYSGMGMIDRLITNLRDKGYRRFISSL